MNQPDRIAYLIEALVLKPHPEGGYFREMFKSGRKLVSPEVRKERSAFTDIYFLLTARQKSRWHRVFHDEVWHFYEGAPLEIIQLSADLNDRSHHFLDVLNDPPRYKHAVPGGCWQAARTLGEYTLVGCSVAPGFEYDDFALLSDYDDSSRLLTEKYPDLVCYI